MKILALLGEASSGKSLTLKQLIEKVATTLYASNPSGRFFFAAPSKRCKTYVDHNQWGGFLTELRGEEMQQPKYIHDAFTIVLWNGKKVGIFTIGDDETALRGKFDSLKDCDIIVCPAHEKRKMLDFLFSQVTEEIWFVRKEKAPKNAPWDDKVAANKHKANDLFKRLNVLVHL